MSCRPNLEEVAADDRRPVTHSEENAPFPPPPTHSDLKASCGRGRSCKTRMEEMTSLAHGRRQRI